MSARWYYVSRVMQNGFARVRDLVNDIQAGGVDKAHLVFHMDGLSLSELRQLGREASARMEIQTPALSWMDITGLVREAISKRV
jgi:hypothetical protein